MPVTIYVAPHAAQRSEQVSADEESKTPCREPNEQGYMLECRTLTSLVRPRLRFDDRCGCVYLDRAIGYVMHR
jgi:hypothetical protein